MKKIVGFVVLISIGSVLIWTVGTQSVDEWVQIFLAESFSEEQLQTELKSYFTQVQGVQKLQLAELKQMEKLSRESRRKVLWQKLELPRVVVALEVPVTYTYYTDLKKPWSLKELSHGELELVISSLEFNTPAADISAYGN